MGKAYLTRMKKTMPKLTNCARKPGRLIPMFPSRSPPPPVSARINEKVTGNASFPQGHRDLSSAILALLRLYTQNRRMSKHLISMPTAEISYLALRMKAITRA
jgi:hypothetical protein